MVEVLKSAAVREKSKLTSDQAVPTLWSPVIAWNRFLMSSKKENTLLRDRSLVARHK